MVDDESTSRVLLGLTRPVRSVWTPSTAALRLTPVLINDRETVSPR